MTSVTNHGPAGNLIPGAEPSASAADVSVVLPAHNSAATITRAVISALEQSAPPREIIVVDDCSTDDTVDIVNRIGSSLVRVIRLQSNRGASGARNAGIRAALGSLIAFLDADDEWRRDKLQRQVEALRADPAITVISCDCLLTSPEGESATHHSVAIVAEGDQAWKQLLVGNFMTTPSVVCRRADLLNVGGFDEALPFGEDLDLWIRLGLRGAIRVVPVVLVNVYGQHSGLSRSQELVEARYIIPMIERYVREFRSRLTGEEARRILGQRYFDIGYRSLRAGHSTVGVRLLSRALCKRWRIARSMALIAAAFIAPAFVRRADWRLPSQADHS